MNIKTILIPFFNIKFDDFLEVLDLEDDSWSAQKFDELRANPAKALCEIDDDKHETLIKYAMSKAGEIK